MINETEGFLAAALTISFYVIVVGAYFVGYFAGKKASRVGRKAVQILLVFTFQISLMAFTTDTPSKTITSDGTASDTVAAITEIDTKNEDGWTLVIGTAAASYTWGSNVDFGVTDQTWVVRSANTNSRTTLTLTSNLAITGGGNKWVTVHGFEFVTSTALDPMITLAGSTGNTGPNFRITNCGFENNGGGNARSVFCEVYGLIDNCDFKGGSEGRIWVRDDAIRWTGTVSPGTTNNMVIESSRFHHDGTPGSVTMSQALDGDRGMRVIFRYNFLTNCNTETHGWTSTGGGAVTGGEGLWAEIHNNTFVLTGSGADNADWAAHVYRAGSGPCFSNDVKRTSGSWWGYNSFGKFRAEQPFAYPAAHQPGQGLVSANTEGRVPIYIWANTESSNNLDGTPDEWAIGDGTMVEDVDYFIGTPMPGYTPLVYPHPLISGEGGGEEGGSSGAPTVNVNALRIGTIQVAP